MNRAFEKILERLEEKENESILKAPNTGDFNNPDYQKWMMKSFGFKESIKIVQEVAEEYKDGWIPCIERLPDVEADVLLSLRSLDIHTGFRSNTEGYFYVDGEGYVEFENVLAWQPLPGYYNKDLSTCADCENAPCDLTLEKIKTNADRIRSMNDKELAMNVMCPNESGLAEIECDMSDDCDCYECVLYFLQQEATDT